MDTREIRRQNLRNLVKQYGGQKELAEAADIAANQLNHLISPNPFRNVGEKLARKIEVNLNLPIGYLDDIHKDTEILKNSAPEISDPAAKKADLILFYDIEIKSNGSGYTLKKSSDDNSVFSKEWAASQGLQVSKLFGYKYTDSNMKPYILPNDLLVINADDKDLRDRCVYLVLINGRILGVRVFRQLNNDIKLSSDNSDKSLYPDIYASSEQISHIIVIGSAAGVLRTLTPYS